MDRRIVATIHPREKRTSPTEIELFSTADRSNLAYDSQIGSWLDESQEKSSDLPTFSSPLSRRKWPYSAGLTFVSGSIPERQC